MAFNLSQRIIDYLGRGNTPTFVAIVTLVTMLLSLAMVSAIMTLLTGTVAQGYVILSILMPLVLTPVIISLVLKLFTRLSCCKQALEQEIQKSKEKDMMLIEQERFALMGEMLSSISHQWRQPLNAINLTLLSARVAQMSGKQEQQELEKLFDTIEKNTLYLSNTIEDFRTFFQNKAPKAVVPVKEIIHELNTIISPILKADGVALRVEWDSNLFDALHVATAISQVLLNLISNSKDAMSELRQREKSVTVAIRKASEGVTIYVRDNGPGIDPQIQQKIFDAYFTTKGKLRGTGIGLHMSRQIIEKIFKGSIVLEESSETGSCFKIDLPPSDCCLLES